MDTKRQQSGSSSNDQEPAVDDVPALESSLACGGEAETMEPPRRPRGFAAMDRALVRELARRGAHASQARGTAHRFTSDEARAAGRKGGSAPHRVRGRSKTDRAGA
jgi:general stress protein YciG